MQATPSCYAYKVLCKSMFDLGNLLFTALKEYSEFYKISEIGLT
jgi:hypothetical protein